MKIGVQLPDGQFVPYVPQAAGHYWPLPLVAGLSARHQAICRGLLRGLTSKEIAREISSTPWAVAADLKLLFSRFAARNRHELTLILVGYIPKEEDLRNA